MGEENKVDLGSIQIHKKVLADITKRSINDIDGVSLIAGDFTHNIRELIGQPSHAGIIVHVDKSNQVSIEVKVTVRYGMNIPEIAHHAQDAIRTAIERTVDISLKEVNVNIQGIERGKQ